MARLTTIITMSVIMTMMATNTC